MELPGLKKPNANLPSAETMVWLILMERFMEMLFTLAESGKKEDETMNKRHHNHCIYGSCVLRL